MTSVVGHVCSEFSNQLGGEAQHGFLASGHLNRIKASVIDITRSRLCARSEVLSGIGRNLAQRLDRAERLSDGMQWSVWPIGWVRSNAFGTPIPLQSLLRGVQEAFGGPRGGCGCERSVESGEVGPTDECGRVTELSCRGPASAVSWGWAKSWQRVHSSCAAARLP